MSGSKGFQYRSGTSYGYPVAGVVGDDGVIPVDEFHVGVF
jgi:hypothetical protein